MNLQFDKLEPNNEVSKLDLEREINLSRLSDDELLDGDIIREKTISKLKESVKQVK